MDNAIFIYDGDELRYRFNDDHPFNQKRLQLTVDLLQACDALPDQSIIPPRIADDKEIMWVHGPSYIEAVKALSVPNPAQPFVAEAERFGLNTEDTPFFENMHKITSMVVGGSINAAERVMSGKGKHALHLGGGLHHALQNKGAGFCVYNDAAIAIEYIKRQYGAKVLYIDTDVHHGDGVQWFFYTDPQVCTLSIHETGKYLFPGTGAVNERGQDQGFGTSINVPVEPYTEDESWLDCFHETVEKVIAQFRPDVIVSQHGCDAHAYDPLAHIHCSMSIYREMPVKIHQLAHEWCEGRWVALGGGGYDIWRVVPRAWSMVWLAMIEHPILRELENNELLQLPPEWIAKWAGQSPVALPTTWLDNKNDWAAMPRRQEITAKNEQTKRIALLYLNK